MKTSRRGARSSRLPYARRSTIVDVNRFATPLLDRELLAGIDPLGDPTLERRGRRVCSRRRRDKLAAALETLVAKAERDRPGLSAAVPLPRAEVLDARIPLFDLARRLRSDAPVDPQGVLLVRRLLSDPHSALNSPSSTDSVRTALRRARAALAPR